VRCHHEFRVAPSISFHLGRDYARIVKILIVEDNPGVRRMLRRVVEGLATEIHESEDGDDAIKAYAEQLPDLVLMDIHMHRMDGLTATRQIRAFHPAARVLIVTAYEDEELRSAAQDAGACGYVLKDKLTDLPRLINAVMR
jgi:CheY-like chemotaxis protein